MLFKYRFRSVRIRMHNIMQFLFLVYYNNTLLCISFRDGRGPLIALSHGEVKGPHTMMTTWSSLGLARYRREAHRYSGYRGVGQG